MSAFWDGTAGYNLQSTNVTDPDIQFLGLAPFSMAIWVRRPSDELRMVIGGVGEPLADIGWFMEILDDNTLRAYRASGAGDARASGIVAATWQHLAMVYDPVGGKVWAYVDGVGASANTATEIANGHNKLILGYADLGASLTFSGHMNDMGIWNATLLPQEIKSMAQGLSARYIRPTALVRYADLNQNTKTPLVGELTASGVSFLPFIRAPYTNKEDQRAVEHRLRIRGQR